MEAKGHEEIAKTSGIPLLKEIFQKARREFKPSYAHAFYMGNWLRDLSQVIDPVAMAGLGETLDKIAGYYYDVIIHRTVPVETAKNIPDAKYAFTEDKNNLMTFIRDLVKTRNKGRDSNLQRILRFLIKYKAFYKFCQPDKDNPKKIPKTIFFDLFDDFYSQYFPHEHLDRPFDHKEGNKIKYADKKDNKTRDPDNQNDPYLNIYSYLKDDIFVLSGILADVDRNWASRFLSNDELGDDYSTHYYIAQIGRALHGVEDFFAHSNFIEHACSLMSAKFMDENNIWKNTLYNKRLKKYDPWDIEEINTRMNGNWEKLKAEPNIVTGYFDLTDTAVSLGHLLEEIIFGDQNEYAIDEFFKKLGTFFEEPASFVKSKFDSTLLDQPELTRFTELQPDTIQWLTSEFMKDDFILRDPLFRRDLQAFLKMMSNPYVIQSIRTYSTGYEYFKDMKELFEEPINFIYKKFDRWIIKKAGFYTLDYIIDRYAYSRMGCHSLMAKDTTDAFLYSHGLNCAKAVHWYIVNTLGRWADPQWTIGRKDDNKWVNWTQLCEFFLSHPFSDLVIEKHKKEFIIDTYHIAADNKPMYEILVELGEKYKGNADFRETEHRKYWELIADVNFDLTRQMEKMGYTSSKDIQKAKKDILNKHLNVQQIGEPIQFGQTAQRKAVFMIIPLQKWKVDIPVHQPNADKWFIRIMQGYKAKTGPDDRWRIFEKEQESQGKFLTSRYHKYQFYQSTDKNDLEPARKVDRMIEKAKQVQKTLENQYQPKQSERALVR